MGQSTEPKSSVSRPGNKARRAGRWVYGGTTALSLGIIASLADLGDLAAQLTLVGFVAAVFGLHLLGRSGPTRAVRPKT